MKISARRQLDVIEGLALLWEDGCKTIKQAELIISDIYRFAHIGGTCENPHEGWKERFLKVEKELKKMGIK